MSTIGELEGLPEAARRIAALDSQHPTFAEPARRLAVLTCMDARIEPLRLLGLALGDAHVIRNAGGRATDDALRSLALSTHLLGVREVALIQHTGCGLLGASNEALRAAVAAGGGDASSIDFLPIDDLDASVRADVLRLRASPALSRALEIAGFVYDVGTSKLRRVPEEEPLPS
ncbi:MAG: carbonic anhydrase [Chloroflexi bacterium]|nr:carbonic anhydrase [Chloroflexota bacterium]